MLFIPLFSAFVYPNYKESPAAFYHQSGRGPPFLFLFIFIFGIYTPCYAWPWIFPLPPFTREGEAESATWVHGTPAVYRGGFFDYATATPRTGGTESDTSRNYRDGRAVRYE